MYVGDTDTSCTTLIEYIGPTKPEHRSYLAVMIRFADDFDISTLPKFVRAHRLMTIDCTPRPGNEKNEAGVKRLKRILKALEGCNTKTQTWFGNSITAEDFWSRAK